MYLGLGCGVLLRRVDVLLVFLVVPMIILINTVMVVILEEVCQLSFRTDAAAAGCPCYCLCSSVRSFEPTNENPFSPRTTSAKGCTLEECHFLKATAKGSW